MCKFADKTFDDVKRLLLSAICLLCLALQSMAQRNEILSDHIATLQVVADDDWLSMPVIKLNSRERIYIKFDDLTHQYNRYAYKVIHCEADWSESEEIFDSDYIDGFADGNTIDDMEESLNTNVLYTHYSLTLPNENCRLKMSGNYKVVVYDDNNDNEPMLVACFMVLEPVMTVRMEVTPNTDIDVNKSHQQVSMEIGYQGLQVLQPERQISTVVLQNGRWDNAKINVKPQFTMADGLRWDHNRQLIFDAGNEYHKFEVLDTDHPTLGIDKIRWDGEVFHAYVFPDEPRPNYLYDEDANGAFYIRNSDNVENDRLTDYVQVHFQLMCPQPVKDDVFVNGVWTNDRFLPKYRMEYDYESRSYQLTLPLKMGYYSYQYVTLDGEGFTQIMPTEGSFFQTENEYYALIYYRELSGRTDRLVGYQKVQFK